MKPEFTYPPYFLKYLTEREETKSWLSAVLQELGQRRRDIANGTRPLGSDPERLARILKVFRPHDPRQMFPPDFNRYRPERVQEYVRSLRLWSSADEAFADRLSYLEGYIHVRTFLYESSSKLSEPLDAPAAEQAVAHIVQLAERVDSIIETLDSAADSFDAISHESKGWRTLFAIFNKKINGIRNEWQKTRTQFREADALHRRGIEEIATDRQSRRWFAFALSALVVAMVVATYLATQIAVRKTADTALAAPMDEMRAELTDHIETLAADFGERIDAVSADAAARLKDLNQRLELAHLDLDSQVTALDKIREHISSIESELGAQGQKVAHALNAQRVELLAEMRNATERVARSMDDRVAATDQRLAGGLEANTREISSLDSRVSTLATTVEGIASGFDEERSRAEPLAEAVARVFEKLQEIEGQQTHLEKLYRERENLDRALLSYQERVARTLEQLQGVDR